MSKGKQNENNNQKKKIKSSEILSIVYREVGDELLKNYNEQSFVLDEDFQYLTDNYDDLKALGYANIVDSLTEAIDEIKMVGYTLKANNSYVEFENSAFAITNFKDEKFKQIVDRMFKTFGLRKDGQKSTDDKYFANERVEEINKRYEKLKEKYKTDGYEIDDDVERERNELQEKLKVELDDYYKKIKKEREEKENKEKEKKKKKEEKKIEDELKEEKIRKEEDALYLQKLKKEEEEKRIDNLVNEKYPKPIEPIKPIEVSKPSEKDESTIELYQNFFSELHEGSRTQELINLFNEAGPNGDNLKGSINTTLNLALNESKLKDTKALRESISSNLIYFVDFFDRNVEDFNFADRNIAESYNALIKGINSLKETMYSSDPVRQENEIQSEIKKNTALGRLFKLTDILVDIIGAPESVAKDVEETHKLYNDFEGIDKDDSLDNIAKNSKKGLLINEFALKKFVRSEGNGKYNTTCANVSSLERVVDQYNKLPFYKKWFAFGLRGERNKLKKNLIDLGVDKKLVEFISSHSSKRTVENYQKVIVDLKNMSNTTAGVIYNIMTSNDYKKEDIDKIRSTTFACKSINSLSQKIESVKFDLEIIKTYKNREESNFAKYDQYLKDVEKYNTEKTAYDTSMVEWNKNVKEYRDELINEANKVNENNELDNLVNDVKDNNKKIVKPHKAKDNEKKKENVIEPKS